MAKFKIGDEVLVLELKRVGKIISFYPNNVIYPVVIVFKDGLHHSGIFKEKEIMLLTPLTKALYSKG